MDCYQLSFYGDRTPPSVLPAQCFSSFMIYEVLMTETLFLLEFGGGEKKYFPSTSLASFSVLHLSHLPQPLLILPLRTLLICCQLWAGGAATE